MKYYLIVGEASGDLHASNLMRELKKQDENAEFRFFGGDLMKSVGGICVKHYKEMAYMGFIPVLLHLRTIFRNMDMCKMDIVSWNPDVVILVDYPGFNLKIASFVKEHTKIPVYYYISPKIWAWKEYRIKDIKKNIDYMLSILPFEIEFYKKHNYEIEYVGNPCMDSVLDFKSKNNDGFDSFCKENGLSEKPVIALLAGSRRQEIKDNLPMMIESMKEFSKDYQIVLAGAPGIDKEYYSNYIDGDVKILFGKTYDILNFSKIALVTSGTATLETALFRVPQVVCYYTPMGKLLSFMKRHILKVKYVSLVNLIAGKEVVKELVADSMTIDNINKEAKSILYNVNYRENMLSEYDKIIDILGKESASGKAAKAIINKLSDRH